LYGLAWRGAMLALLLGASMGATSAKALLFATSASASRSLGDWHEPRMGSR